ncbi:hypothetical protein GCM10018954_085280 [Kutzneria kofuensis]
MLEAVPFEQADRREGDHVDRDRAVRGETGAEGVQDGDGVEAAEQGRDDAGDGDDQHRIQPQREADHHQGDADEDDHVTSFTGWGPWRVGLVQQSYKMGLRWVVGVVRGLG